MNEDWSAWRRELFRTPLLDCLQGRLGQETFEEVVGRAIEAATREAVEGRTQLSEEVFAEALRKSYEEVWFGTLEPAVAAVLARDAVGSIRLEVGLRLMAARGEPHEGAL